MSAAADLGLAGTLAGLEDERQAAFKKITKWILVALAVTAAVTLVGYVAGYEDGVIFIPIAGVIAALIIRGVHLHRVKEDFKRKVMPVLLKSIDPSLQYDPGRCVSVKEFERANLYKKPDRFSGKDFVTGKIGATAVRFSLVHAEEKHEETETDGEGNTTTRTRYETIFRGLFFIADFNKHFATRTKVEPHGVRFVDKLFGSHVEMESPDFNRQFSVSSTDQVEARYIMTPSLMEHFMALRAKVGDFKTAFVNEHVYMTLAMKYDAFEPSLKRPLTEPGQVDEFLSKLKTITGIVGELGLNVRIWTKE